MANISNNWMRSANAAAAGASLSAGAAQGDEQASVAGAPAVPAYLRPSRRVTAVLAAATLASGVAIGAAIGPAPSASFAGNPAQISSLIPLLASPLTPTDAATASSGPAAASPVSSEPRPVPVKRTLAAAVTAPAAAPAATTPEAASSPPSESPTPATTGPTSGGEKSGSVAPVTNVWLIQLSGSTFADALAQPAAAPYIDGPAVSGGMLLSSWSSLDASAFASEAALLAGSPPQLLDSIVQPPCPEGPAGAQCAAGTAGELTGADAFLKQTLDTIEGTAAYRSHGLIVITFGSIGSAAATGLPSGSSSATLTSRPPAGALLISPFATAGSRRSTAFNTTSPKRSVEALLHK